MTINYTTLLGLAKPVTGTESGTWGDVVNDQITSLVEDAIANAASISVTSGNVTLTDNNGTSDQARMAILLVTGSPGVSRNIVAPSTSKWYIVKNGSNAAVVLKGSATTGVTIPAGAEVLAFWNGSDFEIAGMVGPSTSTDNAVARFDGTTGKVVQNSSVVIDDSNNITGIVDETLSGNLNFTGSAKRITGDFSNATRGDRVSFQSSTANGVTAVQALPNGTGATAAFTATNGPDPMNSSLGQVICTATEAGIRSDATGTGSFLPMTFYTGGSEKMRIDTSGNVGIGTNSPGSKLEVNQGSVTINTTDQSLTRLQLKNTGTGGRTYDIVGGLPGVNNSQLSFYDATAAATRMTIDSSGNVGIGTTSPSNRFVVSNSGAAGVEVNPSTGNIFTFNRSTSLYTDMTLTSNTMIFQTGGASERMRIDASGNLLIGYTSSNGSYKLQVNSQIFATNATIATSDGRYKEDIQSLDGALNLVSQLNPVQFSWKEHPVHNFDRSGPNIGFVAQEVEQVLVDKPYLNSIIKRNECVIEPEEKDADGNITKEAVKEEFLGIAEGNMIALLTKAIQELKAELDATKAEVAALKGA